MQSKTRPIEFPIKSLLINFKRFEVNQLIYLLESGHHHYLLVNELCYQIPISNITKVTKNSHDQMYITLSHYGLFGESGVLPHELLPNNQALLRFLNVFNHRFHYLRYQIWFRRQLLHNKQDLDLFQQPKYNSAYYLKILIEQKFSIQINIQQCSQSCYKVATVIKPALGTNSYLGSSVYINSQHFTIIITKLSLQQYLAWLPNTTLYQHLTKLVRSYTSLKFTIKYEITDTIAFTLANNPDILLGYSTRL